MQKKQVININLSCYAELLHDWLARVLLSIER